MNSLNHHRFPLIAVAISFIFWFGLYFGAYLAGWPGEVHPCTTPPYCFCETVHLGDLAAQKSNTWSDLGFVVAAIFMAFHGSRQLKGKNFDLESPAYKQSPLIIGLYVSAILYMGPGSMFFHGAMTQWGGWLDVISMYMFVNFLIAYLVYRSWKLSFTTFFLIYLVLSLISISMAVFTHDLASQVFPLVAGSLISLAILQAVPIEKFALGRKQDLGLEHKWLIFALGFFVTAVFIWAMSDSGRPWCVPDSLLQGHAAWHLLSACMTLCIHYYFLSEKVQEPGK